MFTRHFIALAQEDQVNEAPNREAIDVEPIVPPVVSEVKMVKKLFSDEDDL